jgi:hypothetical protein
MVALVSLDSTFFWPEKDSVALWVLVIAIIAAGFLCLQLVPRLFPRRIGSSYFRKQLWLKGIDWRKLPSACLDDFVNEAFDYAKAASKPDKEKRGGSDSFLVEYERMMRVHAIVVAALLKNRTPGDIEALERNEIESRIQTALMKGDYGLDVARAEVGKTLSAESLHVALVRAALDPFDMDGQERILEDVRIGKTWDLQREILRRHGLFPAS